MSERQMLMDPRVSKIKFQREVDDLRQLVPYLRGQGWIIESTEYPFVRVTFISTKTSPPIVAVTTEINFSNYNYLPLSVRFLNPINFTPMPFAGGMPTENGPQEIIIANHPKTGEHFLCLPGVWEYHSHPQHSDNPWDLHRYDRGEGTMYSILNSIWLYCIKIIKGFQFQMPQFINLPSAKVILELPNE